MIERDGSKISLWQDTTAKYSPKNIGANREYDIIIVGGGITGITTALMLQQAGKKCAVLEARALCFGTTGGTTAHLNTVMDTPYPVIIKNFGKEDASLIAQMAKQVITMIKNNIKKYSIDCGFEETMGYMFAQNEDQEKELKGIADACAEVGVKVSAVKNIPIKFKFTKALQISGQAKFHPTKYVFALASAFEELGGVIAENCRVESFDENSAVQVQTSTGMWIANQLIFATHIPPGKNFLNLRCAPYRTYAMAFTLEHEKYPDGLVYDMYDPYHYYRTQKIGRKKFLIAGGEDHKTGHVENTSSCFLKLEAHIRSHFSVRQITHQWSSQYFEPVDGIPYIGHLPGSEGNIFVATGFGGNGMIYSGTAAIVFKQMILSGDTEYIELFDPNRIKPIAGFTNFVKENADTVKEMLRGLLPAEKLKYIADLAPGEGRIIKLEDKTIALSKDESGNVHAVDPRCTHMGCHISWNESEKSWDCPCHGSRYSLLGKVLTGPAIRNLETIDLSLAEEL